MKEPRDSQIPKFSQPAQPWRAGFNEGRGGGRKKGKVKGRQGGGWKGKRGGKEEGRERGREGKRKGREREGGERRVFKTQTLYKAARE